MGIVRKHRRSQSVHSQDRLLIHHGRNIIRTEKLNQEMTLFVFVQKVTTIWTQNMTLQWRMGILLSKSSISVFHCLHAILLNIAKTSQQSQENTLSTQNVCVKMVRHAQLSQTEESKQQGLVK